MKRKSGFIWYLGGVLIIGVSLLIASASLRKLYLPTAFQVIGALVLPTLVATGGIVLIVLGKIIPKRETDAEVQKARRVADGFAMQTYSYETAHEAIEARILAWESSTWDKEVQGRKAVIIETLRTINRGVGDLGKMSSWFNTSLSGPLYDAARDSVGRVDANKLKFLSGFISYCASVTEYELASDYFHQACVNANKEVTGALDLYASMRAKLNSYSGDPEDIVRLKAEMEQITSLF